MRTPWPVYVLEVVCFVGLFALIGFGFGWGVAAGFLGLLAVTGLAVWAAVRYFAKPS